VDPSGTHHDEDFELWVIQTRIEQGLPEHIEDRHVLEQVVVLLGLSEEEGSSVEHA
jgi:hypothetical protein